MVKTGLFSRVDVISHLKKLFGEKQEVNDIVQKAVDEIILQENENEMLCVKMKHMSMRTPIVKLTKKDLYEFDILSPDESYKGWRKRAFESKTEYIYDIKILNTMNRIHDKEVNNIAERNLLHDILNTSKDT